MEQDQRHALVVGASGLIGWSVVNQLLQPYPSANSFTKVTALVNRPLESKKSFWPKRTPGAPELELLSGVDLQCEDGEFEDTVKERIKDVGSITHVYYFGKTICTNVYYVR